VLPPAAEPGHILAWMGFGVPWRHGAPRRTRSWTSSSTYRREVASCLQFWAVSRRDGASEARPVRAGGCRSHLGQQGLGFFASSRPSRLSSPVR
jgi:hypothetical protein